VPYQLQACTAAQVDERLEDTEVATDEDTRLELDERTLEETELGLTELDPSELEDNTLEDNTLEDNALETEEATAPQMAPVTWGVSIAPPLALTCIPNATVWPGWILPFQLRFVAV